jgi:hypothetical protein
MRTLGKPASRQEKERSIAAIMRAAGVFNMPLQRGTTSRERAPR